MSIVTDFTAILAITANENYRWNAPANLGSGVFVTYSFADGSFIPNTTDYHPYDATSYSAFTASQRASFQAALQIYQDITGVIFVEVDEGGMIDVFNAQGSSWGGWANYPVTTNTYTSDGYLVVDNSGDYNSGTYGFETILHELGHALGLEHPHTGVYTLDPSLNDRAHTVMTYNHTGNNATTLGTFDIEALHYLYGETQDTTGWIYGFNGLVFEATGASGDDFIFGVKGQNKLLGKGGADSLYGRDEHDVLKGGNGKDLLVGLAGNDKLLGGNGNDKLFGGGKKNDTGSWDSDILLGGAGNDKLYGQGGLDTLKGQDGNDYLNGGWGADTMYGGLGDDIMIGDGNNDFWGSDDMFGGAGNDELRGNDGYDMLSGGNGKDKLYGGGHNDTLLGGNGVDRLLGGSGNDLLTGGAGKDTLIGGSGNDQFIFSDDDIGKRDVIKDFTDGEDHINLTNTSFVRADIVVTSINSGADTLVTVGGTLEILIDGVNSSLIDNSDFYI